MFLGSELQIRTFLCFFRRFPSSDSLIAEVSWEGGGARLGRSAGERPFLRLNLFLKRWRGRPFSCSFFRERRCLAKFRALPLLFLL